jgi:hypothetical protein
MEAVILGRYTVTIKEDPSQDLIGSLLTQPSFPRPLRILGQRPLGLVPTCYKSYTYITTYTHLNLLFRTPYPKMRSSSIFLAVALVSATSSVAAPVR